jgi:diguanylate cyclase (GGDEF)-like protein/PAS domain S-box-containing protein
MDDALRASALLRELLAVHQRYPALFEDQRAGRVLFDATGELVRANNAALDFLGVAEREVLARGYEVLIAESDRKRASNAFVKATLGETIDVAVTLLIAGHELDVPVTLSPAIVDGAIVGVYATGKIAPDAPTRKFQELTSLFVNTADAVIVFDARGRCVDANAAAEAMTGYPAADLRGRSYRSLLAPEAWPEASEVFERVLRGESVSTDTLFVGNDGRHVTVSGTSVPIVVDGVVVGAYTIARDVTAERTLATALREQTERMRELSLMAASIGDSLENGIVAALDLGCRRLGCEAGYVTRAQSGFVEVLFGGGTARRIPNAQKERLTGSLHERIVAEGKAASGLLEAGFGSTTSDSSAFVGTPIDVNGERSGALVLLREGRRGEDFTDGDRDFVGLLGTLVSSTFERDERRRRAELLAFHDPLTRLANRTLLGDRMEQAIASAERHHTSFAVHFYDLDNFKQINDERGHLRGDDVLRTVARRFESVARSEDTVARIGGDEFVVVQPGVHSRADVESLARRLRAALSAPLIVSGAEYRITASAGIAMFPGDAKTPETLLAHADTALYRVKATGRDGIAFYGDAARPES